MINKKHLTKLLNAVINFNQSWTNIGKESVKLLNSGAIRSELFKAINEDDRTNRVLSESQFYDMSRAYQMLDIISNNKTDEFLSEVIKTPSYGMLALCKTKHNALLKDSEALAVNFKDSVIDLIKTGKLTRPETKKLINEYSPIKVDNKKEEVKKDDNKKVKVVPIPVNKKEEVKKEEVSLKEVEQFISSATFDQLQLIEKACLKRMNTLTKIQKAVNDK